MSSLYTLSGLASIVHTIITPVHTFLLLSPVVLTCQPHPWWNPFFNLLCDSYTIDSVSKNSDWSQFKFLTLHTLNPVILLHFLRTFTSSLYWMITSPCLFFSQISSTSFFISLSENVFVICFTERIEEIGRGLSYTLPSSPPALMPLCSYTPFSLQVLWKSWPPCSLVHGFHPPLIPQEQSFYNSSTPGIIKFSLSTWSFLSIYTSSVISSG